MQQKRLCREQGRRGERDPFLTALHDSLHDSPTQRKFRRIRPMPVGVVFIQWPGMGWEDMREHLRLMKRLGYNCLKGIGLQPGFDYRRFAHMALDEGIIPWWYGEGGWEEITDRLLDKLGIPRGTSADALRRNPRFLAYQDRVMRRRIEQKEPRSLRRKADAYGEDETDPRWRFAVGPELGSTQTRLPREAMREYAAWLEERYGTLAALSKAWNSKNLDGRGGWKTWREAAERCLPGHRDHDYNRFKDVIRFKTDVFLRQLREGYDLYRRRDPDAPVRAGGEMSVFLPLAGRGVNMEGIASLMKDRGSLYPSTHLAWHFDKVNYEIARTIYMYSSLCCDVFKGGWSATWESTGGPQQISGFKGDSPFARTALPAYTVDAGVMTQFMLSYLAAGYKGFGFWCWTPRPFGREGGEYSLLDRNAKPGPRAIRVGEIARAAQQWKNELWDAHKEPLVGVLFDPENDIHWSVMADLGRDILADFPVQARVGAARALINANVPWEHVTADNLRKGLAGRYRAIYLPAMLCVTSDVFRILADYVRDGGRLAMDMPGFYFDEQARITQTGAGSAFEALFGCTLDDYQYSSNVPRTIAGSALTGFVADMTVTRARVIERYGNGRPAVMENACGKGRAVLLGYEAALLCARPGRPDIEKMLVRHTLGPLRPPYRCRGAIAYRLASPSADHYFLVNDGPARKVRLDTRGFRYAGAMDAVSGERVSAARPIALEAYSGRWLRFAKSRC